MFSLWTSPVVQWLRLHAPSAGGPGSIPGQGSRSHTPQLRVCMLQLKDSRLPQLKTPHATTKILCAATKTQRSQINKYFFKFSLFFVFAFYVLFVWKYYKAITVQYYIADCLRWVPGLTLLDLWTCSRNGTHSYVGDLLYYLNFPWSQFSLLK